MLANVVGFVCKEKDASNKPIDSEHGCGGAGAGVERGQATREGAVEHEGDGEVKFFPS